MPSIGEQLRAARERQNLSVSDLAETTKIRGDHLRALEEEDYKAFAAPVYARGFLKNYAAALKLDPKPLLEALDQKLAGPGPRRSSSAAPRPSPLAPLLKWLRALDWRWGAGAAAALALGLAASWSWRTWQRHRAVDPFAKLGPGLYQPALSNQALLLPLPPLAKKP